jgi:hypothetical protein
MFEARRFMVSDVTYFRRRYRETQAGLHVRNCSMRGHSESGIRGWRCKKVRSLAAKKVQR